MDANLEQEIQPNYLHFEFSGNKINLDEFESNKFLIPHVGKGQVSFSRAHKYSPEDKGVTIKDGQLVVNSAQTLSQQGLYDVILTIYGPKNDINCILKLPKIRQELQSLAKSTSDKLENDEFMINSCSTDYWSIDASENKYCLFLPNNPAFLKSIGFRFESSLDINSQKSPEEI